MRGKQVKGEPMTDEMELEKLDACYECSGNGDDYHLEDGELVCNCQKCVMNPFRSEKVQDDD